MVPKTALVPFCPDTEPYRTYAKTVRRFFSDAAIAKATAYWNTGEIPASFKWLAAKEAGYVPKGPSRPAALPAATLGPGRKRSIAAAEEHRSDPEDEYIDPTSTTEDRPRKQMPLKKKPAAAAAAARPKVGRPPKKTDDPETARPIIRRASVDTASAPSAVRKSRNTPPAPKFKPSEGSFAHITHLLPKQPLDSIL